MLFEQLPGSVADISEPKNKQSVKWKSPFFNWPTYTIDFTKPYIINLLKRKVRSSNIRLNPIQTHAMIANI